MSSILKSIELPERVMYIDKYASDGCTSLTEMTVKMENIIQQEVFL